MERPTRPAGLFAGCGPHPGSDEARHAELAWSLDAWLRRRLPGSEHALIDAAGTRAVQQFHDGLRARHLPVAVTRPAGVPDSPVATRLASGPAVEGDAWDAGRAEAVARVQAHSRPHEPPVPEDSR